MRASIEEALFRLEAELQAHLGSPLGEALKLQLLHPISRALNYELWSLVGFYTYNNPKLLVSFCPPS